MSVKLFSANWRPDRAALIIALEADQRISMSFQLFQGLPSTVIKGVLGL